MTQNETPVESGENEDDKPADGLLDMLKPGKSKEARIYAGILFILIVNNLGFGVYALIQGQVLLGALRLVIAFACALMYVYSRVVADLLKTNRNLVKTLRWSHGLNMEFMEAYDKAKAAADAEQRAKMAQYAPYKPSEQ